MTYSLDFRKKVLSVKDKEEPTIKETAQRFDIGVASVVPVSLIMIKLENPDFAFVLASPSGFISNWCAFTID